MKLQTIPPLFLLFSCACALAQQTARPQLKLRIANDKESYALKETLVIKAELTNLTSRTLCFPVPDQECSVPVTGWLKITGESVTVGDSTRFICHVDGRGAVGDELDSNIRDRWIKVAPNAIYVFSARKPVVLNDTGDWELTASYHPPEGSFGAEYGKILQSAAKRAGCQVPRSRVTAEPKIVHVH